MQAFFLVIWSVTVVLIQKPELITEIEIHEYKDLTHFQGFLCWHEMFRGSIHKTCSLRHISFSYYTIFTGLQTNQGCDAVSDVSADDHLPLCNDSHSQYINESRDVYRIDTDVRMVKTMPLRSQSRNQARVFLANLCCCCQKTLSAWT